jgi:hypothetical protein
VFIAAAQTIGAAASGHGADTTAQALYPVTQIPHNLFLCLQEAGTK